jgi:hypothetical protein
VLVETLMEGDSEGITKSVIAAAKSGDMAAARLVLERIAPVRKGRPVAFKAPTSLDAAGVAEALANLITQMASGEITPDEAIGVANVLEGRRKAIETEQLEERLKVLEEQLQRSTESKGGVLKFSKAP